MNNILKEKTSLLKDHITDVTHKHAVISTKIDAQKKYIKDVKAINKEQREEKLKLIADFQDEIKTLHGKNKQLSDSIQSQLPNADVERGQQETKIKDLEAYKTKFNIEVRKIVKDVQFFENNDICPTCDQTITEETKATHILEGKGRAKELQAGINKADEGLRQAQEALSSALNVIDICRQYQSELSANNQSIVQFQSSIDRTQEEISKLNNSIDMDQATEDLDNLISTSSSLVEEKLALNEQLNYNNVMSTMLKDTGIKTKIVKQYLPVINKMCNQYLDILDFYVSFNLDESFQETIRSRFRDNFSYDSFSEGEKQRIDLALLFTWRMVAKMKNSVATNLLILDETFDSSLDHEGVDNLMKIIYTLGKDTNIFVISHKRELLDDKFPNKLEIIKDKNFSRIK